MFPRLGAKKREKKLKDFVSLFILFFEPEKKMFLLAIFLWIGHALASTDFILVENAGIQCPETNHETTPRDLDEIIPGIYLGNSVVAQDLETLQSLRISHIVNAAEEIPNYHPSLTYTNIPLRDDLAETITPAMIAGTNEAIRSSMIHGSPILIHCHKGVSRSASLVIAHLITVYHLSFCEALDLVKSRRHGIAPNPAFMRQLSLLRN